MILVTGATGTIGSELVPLLARRAAVRAMTRRPSLPGEVYGDLDRPETLPAVLDGVTSVFVLVPGYGPDGPVQERALVAAARAAGVRHLVKLSTSGVTFGATDGISAGHRAGEEVVRGSGIPWTILRPGTFMTYLEQYAHGIAHDRTMTVTETDPVSAMVHPLDVAAVAATVLTRFGHFGKEYTITGPEALSPAAQARAVGEVIGAPVRLVMRTVAQTRAEFAARGWGGARLEALLELKRQSAAWDHRVSDTVPRLAGRPALTLRDWLREHAGLFTGGGSARP
ncbi:NAD(P)H-binding protein [Dactylosporangium aurantiacum]|uniref:NAD(P)H-binding protein n=1 Tax=Dactylosporangium aurantiacum TaxID=35754 RepID=A0A9Q9IA28_9ACTN|nr:NAD(P)H-binding protein [Dactylosporangium aurantiacum]MDG6106506.1 NAD(P)H-binding protein [Dactylosporangium aurantiacum]UWZ50463.1 NAD(P)H-binding protein [Dactylosporangium aurantiacum]